MTPREFLNTVTIVNARLALDHPEDIRHAVNAITSLDAFFGILHAALREQNRPIDPNDSAWKETLAAKNESFRLLRDIAYALKHGKLDGRMPRLVRKPDQVFSMPGAFEPAAFSKAFDTGQVWISTDANDFRADEVIGAVVDFAEEHCRGFGS